MIKEKDTDDEMESTEKGKIVWPRGQARKTERRRSYSL